MESDESVKFIEKSDLSTEIASETDQNFDETVEDSDPPVDPNEDTLQPLAEIKKRPHRTICGKFYYCT